MLTHLPGPILGECARPAARGRADHVSRRGLSVAPVHLSRHTMTLMMRLASVAESWLVTDARLCCCCVANRRDALILAVRAAHSAANTRCSVQGSLSLRRVEARRSALLFIGGAMQFIGGAMHPVVCRANGLVQCFEAFDYGTNEREH